MLQTINAIRLILTLFPLIIEAVKTIEAAVPAGGKGAEKLALLRETLAAGYAVASDASIAFADIWPALERVVAAVVGLFNRVGAFAK